MSLDEAVAVVDKLYDYRDHYFENFGLESASQKTDGVASKMKEALDELDQLKDDITNKSVYFMLRGKVLNVLPKHDTQAHEALSKAVKLDPKLVEAWNQLGDSFWKNGDIPSAKNCFTGALGHSKNKTSLRNLSMVLRQIGGTPSERIKLIEESVEKAKEAVQLDIQDGTSWLILGNAYLSLFFGAGQNPVSLKQCLSAYLQAERDVVAKNNPDLHYNRATAYKYQEEYQQALVDFNMAVKLDPGWNEPQDRIKQMLTFLRSVVDLTGNKGKMKPKKLQALLQTFSESDLGPYSGGEYKSAKGHTIKLEKIKFNQLNQELNSEKVIIGKVVCTITHEDPVPFTFCFVDEENTCLPVTVYNIAQGYGVKIGDAVAIPEPFVQSVKVGYNEQVFDFRSIRVDTPVVLVVNGKKLGLDKQAPTVLSVSAVCD